VILGTAGHIDHGKTALIKALTGVDTDRLKEERERGISIDLGFAELVAGDVAAGIVDVPGHERFIRNMLAGAHGMDVVLLVVAADDGVMPQTEEHLDIVHLLGVRRAVVAMTKVDLVSPARRAAVREEIAILLAGTPLEEAPVIDVSTVTGEGVAALRTALAAALRTAPRAAREGVFRLPIDRAFIMHGHGVVVTGTAIAGTIAAGATVRILPGGATARVRAVQVHGRPAPTAGSGQRVALNLAGIERAAVGRGQIVCDPRLDRATHRFDAWVELRPAARRPLARHAAVRLHLGTAEALATVVWLDGRAALAPNASAYAQLVLRSPVAAFGGDRFILRTQNARATIGGGRVVYPFASRPAARVDPRLPRLAALHRAASARERLAALLELDAGCVVAPDALAAAADLESDAVRTALAGDSAVRALPNPTNVEAYTTAGKWQQLRMRVEGALTAHHGAHPREPGLEMEALRGQVAPDVPAKVFRVVVDELAREGVLARRESILRRPGHTTALDADETRIAIRVLRRLESSGFTPPDTAQLAGELQVPPAQLSAVLAELERNGRVVRATAELCFAAMVVERARELFRAQAALGAVTAAGFRDRIHASRKFSLALLNYFDRTGFTLRVGDARVLRRG
jgi:selenocysteine-specific elongation factor